MIESKFVQLDETFQTINALDFDVSELPILVAAINQCFDDVEFSYKKLSRLIKKDLQLSALIFKLVNSGVYRRPEIITNLDSALMLLGFKMIRNLIFSHKLKALLGQHNPSVQASLSKRWIFTLHHAANTMELAKALYLDKPEEMFLAVIFSDIAAFILADKISKKDININEKQFYEKCDQYKYNYAQKALINWNFNPRIIEMMGQSNPPCHELTEMDVIELAYSHMKGDKVISEQAAFKKLPVSAQLTHGRQKLLILKNKEQDIKKMVASLI
ncbi:hypothetical protein A9Q81_27005 [Gammaproteobacteria bacterium 42_54_T18]|nr:hypothetical protein A9Q81_27005 [Gammaproteobacteria bacterium 42_54_T18]